MRTCSGCKITKDNSEYSKDKHDKEGIGRFCKDCRRDKRQEKKRLVFSHYGKSCSCCGESTPEFLVIDHIHGGGSKERRKKGAGAEGRGSGFYLYLIRNNFPKGYRTLCHNCNSSLGHYGYCPHNNT